VSERTRDKLSRLSSIALMIAILVIAAGVSAITAMRLAIAGTEVTVPSLEGKTEEEAEKILSETKLFLRVDTRKRFSQTVPADRVLEQDPPSGTRLKTGRSVKVLVSAGARRYAVPNLVGSSLRAAQLTLAQRNFVLGNSTMTHTVSGEPMTIQQQDPQPGSQEGADPTVNVLVSLGPIEQSFVMPDVVGKRLDQIGPKVRAEGFKLDNVRYRKAAGVEPGLIMQQLPQAGHRLSKNDAIDLEVSQ
jgi:serine/threonine-protein kinase